MPVGRDGHVSFTYKGRLYVWGGTAGAQPAAQASAASAKDAEEQEEQEEEVSATVVDAGDDLWCLELAGKDKGTWSKVNVEGERPRCRSSAAIAVVGDAAWLYGGVSQEGWSDAVYKLDLTSKKWSKVDGVTGKAPPQSDKLRCVVKGPHILFWGGFGPKNVQVGYRVNGCSTCVVGQRWGLRPRARRFVFCKVSSGNLYRRARSLLS